MNKTTIEGEYTTATVMLPEEEVGELVEEQIQGIIDHEAFRNDVVIMPDTHPGAGSVIGFTMSIGERVVPNTIGVDIGCGLAAANLGNTPIHKDWGVADDLIRDSIPFGFKTYDDFPFEAPYHMKNDFPWERANRILREFAEVHVDINPEAAHLLNGFLDSGGYDMEYVEDLCDRVGADLRRVIASVGTLGGGNHFIEVNESQRTGDRWVVIHSGSRGIGLKIATHHQDRATELTDNRVDPAEVFSDSYLEYIDSDWDIDHDAIRADYEGKEIAQVIDALHDKKPSRDDRNTDLDYLEGDEAAMYYIDMVFAQQYAYESRQLMLDRVASVLDTEIEESFQSVHNFIDFRDQTIRKGATRSYDGERAIVPLNMRDGTLIVEGGSNDAWNRSVCHGAGRVMSRTQAHDELDAAEFRETMDGIVASKLPLDESPMAYKDAALIEEAIGPTAEIVDRLEPRLNLKAD